MTRPANVFVQITVEILISSDVLEMFANFLVDGFAAGTELFAYALDQAFINGKSYVHLHIIRGHILCVNSLSQKQSMWSQAFISGNCKFES